MYNGIIIHYNEIAIKGANRVFFEKKLITNITFALGNKYRISRRYGFFYIPLSSPSIEEISFLKKVLSITPGIANFSFVNSTSHDLEAIKEEAYNLLKEVKFNSFKVDTRRSYKQFPLKSPQVNALLGEKIAISLKKKVKIKDPDLVLMVEISEKEVSLFLERIPGVDGLPVGVSAKVICSLSGGIDSPIAAYLFMKRGCLVTFVHIYNNTLVKDQILEKIKKLVESLKIFQFKTKLYVVPFSDIQKNIVANVSSDYRMIIYRRYMFKIIEQIAKKEDAKAIVTGDCIGQVASQTIENLTSIYSATTLPTFSPLIAFDKQQIIKIAKEIGTYETSILPYPDCCSFMISKHPKTKTLLSDILKIEENIDTEKQLIIDAIKKADVFLF